MNTKISDGIDLQGCFAKRKLRLIVSMRTSAEIALLALAFGSSALAQEDERAVLGVGTFTRNGLSTTTLQVGYYFSLEPDQFYEIGGELQYRTLRTTVFGVPDVEITSISVPGIISLKLLKPPIVPYAGIGVLLGFSGFDKTYVESRQPGLTITDPTGSSFGFIVLGGMKIHLESGISFFGEYRVGWESFPMELNGVRSSADQGGAWLLGGLGIRL